MGAPERAFGILKFGFVALPIIAGIDKFFNVLVQWEKYLSPTLAQLTPLSVAAQMRIGGVIEILAGCLVAVNPRLGGYVVAAWLWAIIGNLLLIPGYYDIAARDFGLSLAALALAQLAGEPLVPPARTTSASWPNQKSHSHAPRSEEALTRIV